LILWEFILAFGAFLENKFPLDIHVSKRIIIQIIATYLIITIIGDSIFMIAVNIFHAPLPPVLKTFSYLLFFLLSIVLNLIYFGTIYFFNWKKDLVNLANMQREQAIVKYDALRNQLNPHFLFNALTSLNSLIFENQQLASNFLQQLSKVYRYVLQNKEKETVSLSTELDFISHYIFLLKTRFGNGIEFQIGLPEKVKEKEIVPVTLQILIENAIKHNVVSNEAPLRISISIDDKYLNIVNSVNKKTQVESSNKQGLENLKSLYQYLTDRPIDIIETDSLFQVRIPLI
jgi:two-component system, LytTR family, sensor kinase